MLFFQKWENSPLKSYAGRYLSINSAEHPQTYKDKLTKRGYLKYFRHSKVRYEISRGHKFDNFYFWNTWKIKHIKNREEIKYLSSPKSTEVVVYIIKKYFPHENCRTDSLNNSANTLRKKSWQLCTNCYRNGNIWRPVDSGLCFYEGKKSTCISYLLLIVHIKIHILLNILHIFHLLFKII